MGSLVHCLCFLAAITHAQPQGGGGGGASPGGGGGSSSSCATDGSSAAYEETIGTTGGVATRTIVTTTCPNHEAMCTGKDGVSGCGAIGANGDSTEASDQDVTKVVPASPVLKTRYTADDTKCEMGEIAYALNGVSIFSGAVESGVFMKAFEKPGTPRFVGRERLLHPRRHRQHGGMDVLRLLQRSCRAHGHVPLPLPAVVLARAARRLQRRP